MLGGAWLGGSLTEPREAAVMPNCAEVICVVPMKEPRHLETRKPAEGRAHASPDDRDRS